MLLESFIQCEHALYIHNAFILHVYCTHTSILKVYVLHPHCIHSSCIILQCIILRIIIILGAEHRFTIMCMCFVPLAHGDMLEVTTSVFLSCALAHMPLSTPGGQSWSAISDPFLVSQATQLLGHTLKLLCVLVHVIEQREPEIREKV